jgi:hypothetical protein
VQHHYEGHWKGWALKIETFLGPEMSQAKRVPFGPKKVEDLKVFRKYRCHPVDLEIPTHFRQNILILSHDPVPSKPILKNFSNICQSQNWKERDRGEK